MPTNQAGTSLKQQAVLFRTSSHSGALEVELTRRNIPYVKFGGLKFLDAAHVKDVMSVLRFIQNPRDRVVGFRVMQILPGVGPVSAQRVLDHIAQAPDPIDALQSAPAPARVGLIERSGLRTTGDSELQHPTVQESDRAFALEDAVRQCSTVYREVRRLT